MVIEVMSSEDPEPDEFADHQNPPVFSNEKFLLGGRFLFYDSAEAFIGLGSFGVVFKGRDEEKKKDVAIKRMLSAHIKENELSVIKSLESQYLIGLIDIVPLNDTHSCLVMELCDTDLDNHIRYSAIDGKLNPTNLRLLVDNLARGYMALHQLKIVHRDIKPQNILVKYTPCSKQFMQAKITDFGIARQLDNGEMCNVAGTLYYMAPEVGANLLKTCQYNAEVDMWSIGCLIFQCVVGEVPFNECSLCKIFLHTAGANYEAYDHPELPAGVSDDLARLIFSLLEIDSSKRATPEDFYERATKFSSSQPGKLLAQPCA